MDKSSVGRGVGQRGGLCVVAGLCPALTGRSPVTTRARYALQPFANSTRLRRAIPDGPLAIHGLFSSIHAVPAMSRWIQGVSSANSFRNIAAEMAPPQRPPEFTMSAMFD